MLRDKKYNGTLMQGKTRRISYKNHKCIQEIKNILLKFKVHLKKYLMIKLGLLFSKN